MSTHKYAVTVKLGQIYRDTDPRYSHMSPRFLQVLRRLQTGNQFQCASWREDQPGRVRRVVIRADRLRSSAYALCETNPGGMHSGCSHEHV